MKQAKFLTKEDRQIRRILLAVALGFLIGIVWDSFSGFFDTSARIRQEVLRLHVLANSDSDEDQALKLKVRDRILSEAGTLFYQAETESSARKAAEENLPLIEAAAKAALKDAGAEGTVRVKVTRQFFDTRVYDGFTLPAGQYDAVQVILGEGKGHNWWCVLYPGLCFPDPDPVVKETSSKGYSIVFETAPRPELHLGLLDAPKYEVRFFLLELAEKIGIWFRSR